MLSLTLADGQDLPSQASFGLEKFRAAIKLVGQETRFKIFCLIAEHPGCLTLDDVCERMGGSKDRYYHQAYQLIQAKVIEVTIDSAGKKCFCPSGAFLSFGAKFFQTFNETNGGHAGDAESRGKPADDVGPIASSS